MVPHPRSKRKVGFSGCRELFSWHKNSKWKTVSKFKPTLQKERNTLQKVIRSLDTQGHHVAEYRKFQRVIESSFHLVAKISFFCLVTLKKPPSSLHEEYLTVGEPRYRVGGSFREYMWRGGGEGSGALLEV
ncbi:hypothetical protein SUGI_1137740 [Cryptomeria japonica]|nr:hypothetical protein SUGI_1137740 [Cryptomeria japonica]